MRTTGPEVGLVIMQRSGCVLFFGSRIWVSHLEPICLKAQSWCIMIQFWRTMVETCRTTKNMHCLRRPSFVALSSSQCFKGVCSIDSEVPSTWQTYDISITLKGMI